jgi:hypothetical protein
MNTMQRAGRAGAALLVLAACTPRSAPAAVAGGDCVRREEATIRTYVVADPPGVAVLGARPFTATCRLPAEVLRGLAQGAPDAAVLYVEGLRAPADRAVTVQVYLGAQDEPAGSFTLLAGGGAPRRVPVVLGHALGAALREGGEVSITLRAGDTSEPGAFTPELGFDRMVIEFR